jgi:DNA-binding ferritin-like protein
LANPDEKHRSKTSNSKAGRLKLKIKQLAERIQTAGEHPNGGLRGSPENTNLKVMKAEMAFLKAKLAALRSSKRKK